jgi:hypothetical protein
MGDPSISGTLSYVDNNTPRELIVTSSGSIARASAPEPIAEDRSADEAKKAAEAAAAKAAADEAAKQQAQAKAAAEKAERERQQMLAEQERQAKAAEAAARDAAAKAKNDAQASAQTSTIPEPETGVTYKVQIMAAHRVVDRAYFKSRHGFDEAFGIENHEGWVKYTTGRFDVYKGARDDRERIRNRYNFKGPFVTAYNDGERITVQEALMITRQKWYK